MCNTSNARMRVLAVNQFYPPDLSATSQLLGELCEDLAAAGHEVDVIASQGTYLGGARLDRHERLRGVEVHRLWATSFGKGVRVQRMVDYATFGATAVAAAIRRRRPDVLLVLTTPPMIAFGMAAVATVRKVPLVTWVQDVYPEVAAAFGVLDRDGTVYRGLRAAAGVTHRRSTRIVALSDGMAERLVAQGAERSAIRVIPNWADARFIRPMARNDNPFRREHALEDRFVVMYSGNLGQGHDVATLVAAARILENRVPAVQFVFIGSGGRRAEAESLAKGLSNVRFLPYQKREDLPRSLSAADVHLVSLLPGLDGLLVPSKLYAALASGRGVCYVGPEACEVARVIRSNGIGWEGRNGDAQGLAAAIERVSKDLEEWDKIGRLARRIFEDHYDRAVCVARWAKTLEEARA